MSVLERVRRKTFWHPVSYCQPDPLDKIQSGQQTGKYAYRLTKS